MLIQACVVTEEAEIGARVERVLRQPDVLVSCLEGPRAWKRLDRECFDLVVATRAAVPEPYQEAVEALKRGLDGPELVVLSEDGDPERRAELQEAGVFAVVDRDLPEPSLRKALNTMVRRRREALLGRLRRESDSSSVLPLAPATASPAMHELLDLAERLAAGDSSVLLVGETGVGKEWLARWIHDRGRRSAEAFLGVNCAALPGELVESELFGHEAGAFTGAHRARRGQFELAHRGTLFLDEIVEMPVAAQAKLLRVLQERRIRRVGGEVPVDVDVRIMAAMNRDPREAIRIGRLREDLYYRLGVVTLEVPPLRDRSEDLPALVAEQLESLRRRLGRPEVREVDGAVLEVFQAYSWPGNVRELINVLERGVLLSTGTAVTLDDVPDAIVRSAEGASTRGGPAPAEPEPAWGGRFWHDTFAQPLTEARGAVTEAFERAYLHRLLDLAEGKVGEAARRAGIDERTLYNKMRRHGLAKEQFRKRKR